MSKQQKVVSQRSSDAKRKRSSTINYNSPFPLTTNCRIHFMVPWNIESSNFQDGSSSNVPNLNYNLLDSCVDKFDSLCKDNANDNFVGTTFEHVLFASSESQGYLDIGDMSSCCKYCNSIFWYEERSKKSVQPSSAEFSLCCMRGKISLPYLKKPPLPLFTLYTGCDSRSAHFLRNIRAYNSMFAFTSMGGKVESKLNDGNGPPQFVISGQNYHHIGSLLPIHGENPKFAQLYIYDTENEVRNRMKCLRDGTSFEDQFDSTLVQELSEMINQNNVLAKSFRQVRDYLTSESIQNLSLRLFRKRANDPRTYNLPCADEVATLVIGDFDASDCGRDIIVRSNGGQLQRIHETHTSFIPLQYPLLFPYGEDGYQEDIPFRVGNQSNQTGKRKRISLREFISFRIQDRQNEDSMILSSRKLFQQFVVDSYSMIESQRLSFIRHNQNNIRKDFLLGLEEAVNRGDINPATIGSRVILPSSFIGGYRYMFNNCLDAMAICRRFGYPDLFLTITCNPKWPEIRRYVDAKGLNAYDRPDIICRLFHIKLQQLMSDLKKGKVFGKVNAGMYTIEFQKRGLPHAHILLWLDSRDKVDSPNVIDSIICAEFPSPNKYPKLFEMVSTYMVHGPCGFNRKGSPCMKDGKCSKFFPKKYMNNTSFDSKGYPVYRRRDSGISITRKSVELDNRFIVPYNPLLLMKYQAHINIEYCNKSNSIKYLFKFINKGVDRVTLSVSNNQNMEDVVEQIDEIKQYYDCRYLSPCESIWRIFSFDIHRKWPSVQRLNFHLPKQQIVIFKDTERIDNVFARNNKKKTMFLAWMDANIKYSEGRGLTFVQFPEAFVYDTDLLEWQPRKNGFSIGRLSYFPPGSGELHYMMLLLNVQRGCTTYDDLRTINGITYESFCDACNALGLISADREFIDGITEAAVFASGHYLRRLFVSLLMSNCMSKPLAVWDETWNLLADGILHEERKALHSLDLTIETDILKKFCLVEIEKLLLSNGKSLKDFESMSCLCGDDILEFGNVLLSNELNFDVNEMQVLHNDHVRKLNEDQKNVYDQVYRACNDTQGGFFFVYGSGGTGKTFLWKTLTYKLRSERKVVLNVASSGIASLLLPGGRTAHSQFVIPLSLNEDSCCGIKQGSLKAELLQHASLIIWDEAPMVNRWAFEALDRTLRDIMRFKVENSIGKPFGGKVVVLGGDFRQILPIIPNANRAAIVLATINSSRLWKYCKVLKLTKNMRLDDGCNFEDEKGVKEFCEWVLALGDGELGNFNDGETDIEIPESLLLKYVNPIEDIVKSTYPNLINHFDNVDYFKDKAILTPSLEVVSSINEYVMSLVPGDEKVYLSSDSMWKVEEDIGVHSDWLTIEFVNGMKCSGLPDHRLVLKKSVPVMLMRNIDISIGLCNGTRLVIEELGVNVIGATIITGNNIGCKVYIPRMNFVPNDHMVPMKFQRRQFPLLVCFAMTINKSQGQTLSHVGVFLPRPVFSHGQLYVAVSRVKKKSGLKILICDEGNEKTSITRNIVYKELFQKI